MICEDSDAKKLSTLSQFWDHISIVIFSPAFILYFDMETLGCLEICLNWVYKFLFIFFNLFSKVPGGLRLGATVIVYTGQLWLKTT